MVVHVSHLLWLENGIEAIRVDLGRPVGRLLRQEMMVFRRLVALEMRKVYDLERILECRTSRTW